LCELKSGPIDGLFLDVGRDDYYGVGGGFDVRKSPWLAKLDVLARPVNVSTFGLGASSPTRAGSTVPVRAPRRRSRASS
jgi:hypothetical protein